MERSIKKPQTGLLQSRLEHLQVVVHQLTGSLLQEAKPEHVENPVIRVFSRPTSSGMSCRAVRGLTPNHFPRQFSVELFLLIEYLCGL